MQSLLKKHTNTEKGPSLSVTAILKYIHIFPNHHHSHDQNQIDTNKIIYQLLGVDSFLIDEQYSI